jgi:hypothetical protein
MVCREEAAGIHAARVRDHEQRLERVLELADVPGPGVLEERP